MLPEARSAPPTREENIPALEAQTEMGRKLAAIRTRIVASGETLLNEEELEREIRQRRGGYDENLC